MAETLSDDLAEQLVTACRTASGDQLRSVVYFTPDEHEFLYLRSDLAARGDEAREEKRAFVDNERLGFTSQETYNRLADEPVELDIGDYEFTIRVFSKGFVSRVIVGDRGVLMTSDSMQIDSFEELAVTLRKLLAGAD